MSRPRDPSLQPTEQGLFDLTEDDETTHGMNRRAAAALTPITVGVPEQIVSPARARELLARRAGMQNDAWTDHMTLEEFGAIRRFWSAQPANTTFMDALEKLAQADESDDAETKLNRHVVVPNLGDDDGDDADGFEPTSAAQVIIAPPANSRGRNTARGAPTELERLRGALERIATAAEYLGAPTLREIARKALER